MKIMRWLLALTMISSPALAVDNTILQNNEAITPDSTIAHIVFRYTMTSSRYATSIIIVRVFNEKERELAIATRKSDGTFTVPQNVFLNQYNKIYAKNNDENIYVLSVPPGRYIIGGLGLKNRDSEIGNGLAFSCFCMGTVSFEVEGGKITDIGTLVSAFDFKPSDIPELSRFVRGHSIGVAPVPAVGGLRPANASRPLPAQFASLPVVPADLRAFGKFPNVLGGSIERLAPIDGILAYDEDRVVDLKAAIH